MKVVLEDVKSTTRIIGARLKRLAPNQTIESCLIRLIVLKELDSIIINDPKTNEAPKFPEPPEKYAPAKYIKYFNNLEIKSGAS
jgi:hypothetical protein